MGAPFKLASSEERFRLIHADVLRGLKQVEGIPFNLIITSPPYNIGKSYERDSRRSVEEYIDWQSKIAETLVSMLAEDGSLCWQVGNWTNKNQEVIPLDCMFYDIFRKFGLKLRNRIIWRFNFGRNAVHRFSGRYETLLWFTKSDKYVFNLDDVRVPQIYPGKRNSSRKGEGKAGLPSGNPLGKNPSDFWEFSPKKDFLENPIWEIPNVKANHVEKTLHPCQFPVELAERCVLAFTKQDDLILDPFVGTGASIIAATKCGRRGVGIDHDAEFIQLSNQRLTALERGELRLRPLGKPIYEPGRSGRVSRVPEEWTAIKV
ncbi:DNA-methyltransferase [Methylobacterium organophilum]|uniref:Methyltransferase n=1 Tax=Methylobacterium organophilum TaxID=410 RepID=A0ABQ4TB90_METOR|nr:site-specific DNA-methyltransferase [Methylobacterium organophilum]GJE28130.1 Modification methylase MboII [Methylobacterium organophilum]